MGLAALNGGENQEKTMGLAKIQEAVEFLKAKIPFSPRIGLITGTGLGDLTKNVEVHISIPYQ
jgi:purine-nucleoside phosphorylase